MFKCCSKALASVFAVAACFGISFHAQAQAQKTYDDRMAEMEAQISLLRKQSELNTALASSAGSEFGRLPTIITIVGFDGKMSAKLLMSNGTVNMVTEGDVLRPGMTVAAIGPRQVIVSMSNGKKDKAKAIALEFAVKSGPGFGGFPGGGPMPSGMPTEFLPMPPSVMTTPIAATTRPGSIAPMSSPATIAPGPGSVPVVAAVPASPVAQTTSR